MPNFGKMLNNLHPVKLFENATKWADKDYEQFSRLTAMFTYGLTSASQCVAFATNKNIPDKERNFMVGQEFIEGVINVTSMGAIATGLKHAGEKVADCLLAKPEFSNAVKNSLDPDSFRAGSKMVFSMAGMFLAMTVVTPILRNVLSPKIEPIIKAMSGVDKAPTKSEQVVLDAPTILPATQIKDDIKDSKTLDIKEDSTIYPSSLSDLAGVAKSTVPFPHLDLPNAPQPTLNLMSEAENMPLTYVQPHQEIPVVKANDQYTPPQPHIMNLAGISPSFGMARLG